MKEANMEDVQKEYEFITQLPEDDKEYFTRVKRPNADDM